MTGQVSAEHPIRELFSALVERAFEREAGLREPELARYVATVLVDFTHRDRLFGVRDAFGRPLEQVADMLAEGDVSLNATGFDRERAVHKHIGDFTLFWTGIYPEMLRALRAAHRADHLLDYVHQGRTSYAIASTFEWGPYESEAPVLRRLSQEFEPCMYGLHTVRRELDACGGAEARSVRRLLEA